MHAERKPKSVLQEKIEKIHYSKFRKFRVLTFIVFDFVLWARSVVLYFLGSNLLVLVSSGKRKIVLRCQTLSLRQQTVNLACHEYLTIALPEYRLS